MLMLSVSKHLKIQTSGGYHLLNESIGDIYWNYGKVIADKGSSISEGCLLSGTMFITG